MKGSTSGSVKFVWMSLDRPTHSIRLLQDKTSEDRLWHKKACEWLNKKKINKMHDNDYLASLACLWKNLVKLKFLVWFSWLVRHVLSSTSDPVEDLNFSGGSRRGAREARPSYFKTKLRPKGPKTNFFFETGLLPSYLRVWMTAPCTPLPYLKVCILHWTSFTSTQITN